MIQSKAWNWKQADLSYWQEAAAEVFPLIGRWKKQNLLRFLDLGCGIGRHALLLAANGFQVTASDLSEDGNKKLEDTAKHENLNICTYVADMIKLPFSDNSFDSLIAYHAIYHTDDEGIKKVIAEIKRVLIKGGEALITFNSQNNSAFKDIRNKHLSTNTVVKNTGHETGVPHFYATKKDVEILLNDFEIVEFNYKEEYWNSEEFGSDYISAHYYVLVKNK